MIARMGSTGGDELHVDDDGSWQAWLVSSGPRAGRFGGSLDQAGRTRISEAATAAAAAGPPDRGDRPWSSGGLVSTFWAGDVVGQFEDGDELPAAWEALATACRTLLGDAGASPVAALELSIDGDGVLRHVGPDELPTDGAGFEVEATLYAADSAVLGSWSGSVPVPDDGTVPAGWEAPLGLAGSGLTAAAGQSIGVWVTGAALDGLPRALTLTAP